MQSSFTLTLGLAVVIYGSSNVPLQTNYLGVKHSNGLIVCMVTFYEPTLCGRIKCQIFHKNENENNLVADNIIRQRKSQIKNMQLNSIYSIFLEFYSKLTSFYVK